MGNDNPSNWHNIPGIDMPLMVYEGSNYANYPNAGLPYSTANLLDPLIYEGTDIQSGRKCVTGDEDMIGNWCDESSEADCGIDLETSQPGICMGIGRYCFNSNNMTNGDRCTNIYQCDDGYTCKTIGSNEASGLDYNNLYISKTDAIERIQNLFAQVYGVWEWNGSSYELCEPFIGNNTRDCELGLTLGDFDISDSQIPPISSKPVISNIIVNSIDDDDVEVPANSGLVNLYFNTTLDLDQLPLMEMYIDWNDGTDSFSETDLNINHQPGIGSPHRSWHIYTCTLNGAGTSCLTCTDGSDPNQDGECVYDGPSINVKDNWGWCVDDYYGETTCSAEDGTSFDWSIIVSP